MTEQPAAQHALHLTRHGASFRHGGLAAGQGSGSRR